jgi:hypothetical protein
MVKKNAESGICQDVDLQQLLYPSQDTYQRGVSAATPQSNDCQSPFTNFRQRGLCTRKTVVEHIDIGTAKLVNKEGISGEQSIIK